jgi:hypothetical protein
MDSADLAPKNKKKQNRFSSEETKCDDFAIQW